MINEVQGALELKIKPFIYLPLTHIDLQQGASAHIVILILLLWLRK